MGNLVVTQNSSLPWPSSYLAKTVLKISFLLHDPSNFFKTASFLYSWDFGDGYVLTPLDAPKLRPMVGASSSHAGYPVLSHFHLPTLSHSKHSLSTCSLPSLGCVGTRGSQSWDLPLRCLQSSTVGYWCPNSPLTKVNVGRIFLHLTLEGPFLASFLLTPSLQTRQPRGGRSGSVSQALNPSSPQTLQIHVRAVPRGDPLVHSSPPKLLAEEGGELVSPMPVRSAAGEGLLSL